MSANVESMMYVGRQPWHSLGVKIDEESKLNVKDGMVAAGLDWTVRRERLISESGIVTDSYANIREADNRVLGVVGSGYKVLQNWEAFDFFNDFLETGLITLETAGALAQGSKIWILAKLVKGRLEVVKGDDIESYLLLSHSHDGSLLVRVGYTPIRVVCWNTLIGAHGDKNSRFVTNKHTKKVKEKLEVIKTTINLAHQEFVASAEVYRAMADRLISKEELEKYIKVSLGLAGRSKGKGKEDDGDSERTKNLINRIKRYFEESPGNDNSEVRGSLWAAYNAVTYYLNFDRGHSEDTRLVSLFWGDSRTKNEKALMEAINLL